MIRFHFIDLKEQMSSYWIIAKPGTDVDLCMSDPGFEVNLFIEAEVKALTSAWMGNSTLETEIAEDRIYISGDPLLVPSIRQWLGQCPYAEAA